MARRYRIEKYVEDVHYNLSKTWWEVKDGKNKDKLVARCPDQDEAERIMDLLNEDQ